MTVIDRFRVPARRAGLEARSVVALARAGMLGFEPPQKTLAIVQALSTLGPFSAAPRIAALKHPDSPAIADERGEITYAQLDEAVDRLANALLARGLKPGANIGILCRNHRSPLIAAFAASRAGMNGIWLNTSFSPRQAGEVAEREGVELLVHDAEFTDTVAEIQLSHGRLVTATDDEADDELFRLIDRGSRARTSPPDKPGRIVLLTSGTTGTPKGAPRSEPKSLTIPGSLLDRMPMKSKEAVVIAPPLYHGTGLVFALVAIGLGSKLVLRRRFDPAQFLDDIVEHRAASVCVVPVMLQRVLGLGEEEINRRPIRGQLRIIFCAGSQLPAEVAGRVQRVFGDVIYNLYGSTEVSVATLATPKDVREAPTSVGRPALGARVKILDPEGREVPQGEVGRIFVGTISPFEGYTGGGHKDMIDGMLSTGDLGHFDGDNRLYIDGRDDEMIVSGGENVFPREVEELLIGHSAVDDVAVIGVTDEDFGQRLKAFVVKCGGASLSEEEIKDFVKENLARYKVPREVVFVDELPRNPTGKILKRELAEAS